MIETKTYGNRKTILISQDSYHVALPVKLSGSANATLKAGQPLEGSLASRLSTEFTAGTSSSTGVLLHEVTLDANGKGNGTIVIVGCIDKLKVDSSIATAIASANINGIILVEGSAI
jgi:hypothetical protein